MSLRDKANADSGRWEPTEEGDYIEGVITALEENVDTSGGKFAPSTFVSLDATTVIVGGVEQGAGSIRFPIWRTVLRREWEGQNPQVGDTIGIAYKGEKPSKKPDGDPYFDYGLAVERGNTLQAAAQSGGSTDGDW